MHKKAQGFDPRQSMNREDFEIFHYLDLKSRHLDAHFHDFYEIFLFLDGNVDYWIDGSLYHLKSGDILLINPSELHKPISNSNNKKYERMVLWIDKQYLNGIQNNLFSDVLDIKGENYIKLLRPNTTDKAEILNLFSNLHKEFYSSDFGSRISSFGALLQVLTQIYRIALSSKKSTEEKYKTSTFIADVLSFINEHYSENLSLDNIAAHFFVSKYYLAHEFSKNVGTSLHRCITLKRLSVAYSLLSEGETSSEVCRKCGFNDYTSFFRAFKNEYKISPSECAR